MLYQRLVDCPRRLVRLVPDTPFVGRDVDDCVPLMVRQQYISEPRLIVRRVPDTPFVVCDVDDRVPRVGLQLCRRCNLRLLPGRVVHAGQHVACPAARRAVQHVKAFCAVCIRHRHPVPARNVRYRNHRRKAVRACRALRARLSGFPLRSRRSPLARVALLPLRALVSCFALRPRRAFLALLALFSLFSLRALRPRRARVALFAPRALYRAVVDPCAVYRVPNVDVIRRACPHAVCRARPRRRHARLQLCKTPVISQYLKALSRRARLALERFQPLRLRALVAVLDGDAVCAEIVSVRHRPPVRRPVGPRVPAHVLPKKRVVHLHCVLIAVVLPVGKIDHCHKVCPVHLVVGRLHQQLRVLVPLIAVADARRHIQQHHFRLDHAFALVEPLGLHRVGKCVRLDAVHQLNHAFQRCHVASPFRKKGRKSSRPFSFAAPIRPSAL